MKCLHIFLFLFSPIVLFAQLRTTTVIPNATDPQINTFTYGNKVHVVYYDSSAKKRNQLYIFLPGTNGTGFSGEKVNKIAAQSGYHVISLQYPDSIALNIYRDVNDSTTYSKGREETFSGENVSKDFNVDQPNSIENRIIKLLLHLAVAKPYSFKHVFYICTYPG
jgi:hypothetical protein